MNIRVDRKALSGFRQRAWRRYPHKEYVEALFGKVISGEPTVTLFYPMEHTANAGACDFAPLEIREVRKIARAYDLAFMGTIHTHIGTRTCPHLSDTDIETAHQFGELICGVMHLYTAGRRRYSEVQFKPAPVPSVTTLI